MNKSTWAKIFGWVGAALGVVSNSGLLGKWAVIGNLVSGLLLGTGIHQSSNTSAGHPNG